MEAVNTILDEKKLMGTFRAACMHKQGHRNSCISFYQLDSYSFTPCQYFLNQQINKDLKEER